MKKVARVRVGDRIVAIAFPAGAVDALADTWPDTGKWLEMLGENGVAMHWPFVREAARLAMKCGGEGLTVERLFDEAGMPGVWAVAMRAVPMGWRLYPEDEPEAPAADAEAAGPNG